MDTPLVNELEAHDFHYGFGMFWYANVNTVYSEGRAKVRPVSIEGAGIAPQYSQSQYSWYDLDTAGFDAEQWFVVLTSDEWETMATAGDQRSAAECVDSFDVAGFHVLVFARDQWEECLYGQQALRASTDVGAEEGLAAAA